MQEPSYHLEALIPHKDREKEDFNGPLDVILLLLSKNKINIEDVSITAILEQYLAYLEERKRLDMEIASEFITMASHLMLIKTKMLLSASEQAEAEDEMEALRHSLLERKRKEALENLREGMRFLENRSDIGRGIFTKGPEPRKKARGYEFRHEPEDLRRALAAALERSRRKLPPPVRSFAGIVGKEPFPVGQKAKDLVRRLKTGVQHLWDLLRGCRSRSELVAGFLAVLELCRSNTLTVGTDLDDPELRLRKEEPDGRTGTVH